MISTSCRRWRPAIAAVLLSPLLVAGAPASLDRRIDVDLVDASAAQVFAGFAGMLGAELDLASTVAERSLTIRLQNVRVRTALDAACESLGCSWRFEPGKAAGPKTLLRVLSEEASPAGAAQAPLQAKLDERLSLDLADAPMETVLGSFAHLLDAELDLDPALAGGEVSLSLTDVPVRVALDTVLGDGWTWRVDEAPGTRRLVIRHRE